MSEATKPMKIAFVALGFPPDVGGTELYNVEYAKRLHARGHDLRVFTWATDEAGAAESDAALPFEIRRQKPRRKNKLLQPDGLAEAITEWQPEVAFISRGSRMMVDVVRAVAKRIPTVVSIHELRQKHSARWIFNRWRVRRRYGIDLAAKVTANSEDTRRRLLDIGVPEDRLAIVYPGADLSHFHPDPASGAALRAELGIGQRPMLLTVSRLAANKGHREVLKALPVLIKDHPELLYLIVGSGGMREPLEELTKELGLQDKVRFMGRVPETLPYYHACDIYVMASTPQSASANAGEGFGIAYVEAGACEKAVIASSSGGGAEIVVDGETGRVVDTSQDGALSDALRQLIADPELRSRLGKAGRARVARYDWSCGVEVLEQTLRSVL